MKKMIARVAVFAIALLFGNVALAEYQCVNFTLEAGDQVQKEIPFNFDTASFYGMNMYHYEKGYPFFGQAGQWSEVQAYESGWRGLYRFVAYEDAGVNLCGEMNSLSGYNEIMDSKDIRLMMLNEWTPGEIGLPPRNDAHGRYTYSYLRVQPGFGVSMKLSQVHKLGDHNGEPVAVIIFSDAGHPRGVVMLDNSALKNLWLNPTEIAILINYEGDDWLADKATFFADIKKANYVLSGGKVSRKKMKPVLQKKR